MKVLVNGILRIFPKKGLRFFCEMLRTVTQNKTRLTDRADNSRETMLWLKFSNITSAWQTYSDRLAFFLTNLWPSVLVNQSLYFPQPYSPRLRCYGPLGERRIHPQSTERHTPWHSVSFPAFTSHWPRPDCFKDRGISGAQIKEMLFFVFVFLDSGEITCSLPWFKTI